jgi:hypothetical protein
MDLASTRMIIAPEGVRKQTGLNVAAGSGKVQA